MKLRLRRHAIVTVTERRVEVPDWRSRRYDELHDGLVAESRKHTPRLGHAHIGDLGFGNDFWCTSCAQRWPCTFIRFVHRLLGGRDDEFQPLRLHRLGDVPDGHGVRTPDGAWMRTDDKPVRPEEAPDT